MTSKAATEPLWVRRMRDFYRRMYELSEVNEYGQRVFEGNTVDLYLEVIGNSSLGHYSRVIATLKQTEAIRFARFGNRYQPSLVELLFDSGELQPDDLPPPEHLTQREHTATLVAELEREVRSLLAWRDYLQKGDVDIAEVLKNFELRLTRLEREVRRNGKKAQ